MGWRENVPIPLRLFGPPAEDSGIPEKAAQGEGLSRVFIARRLKAREGVGSRVVTDYPAACPAPERA
jgi:hypothetical protein